MAMKPTGQYTWVSDPAWIIPTTITKYDSKPSEKKGDKVNVSAGMYNKSVEVKFDYHLPPFRLQAVNVGDQLDVTMTLALRAVEGLEKIQPKIKVVEYSLNLDNWFGEQVDVDFQATPDSAGSYILTSFVTGVRSAIKTVAPPHAVFSFYIDYNPVATLTFVSQLACTLVMRRIRTYAYLQVRGLTVGVDREGPSELAESAWIFNEDE